MLCVSVVCVVFIWWKDSWVCVTILYWGERERAVCRIVRYDLPPFCVHFIFIVRVAFSVGCFCKFGGVRALHRTWLSGFLMILLCLFWYVFRRRSGFYLKNHWETPPVRFRRVWATHYHWMTPPVRMVKTPSNDGALRSCSMDTSANMPPKNVTARLKGWTLAAGQLLTVGGNLTTQTGRECECMCSPIPSLCLPERSPRKVPCSKDFLLIW